MKQITPYLDEKLIERMKEFLCSDDCLYKTQTEFVNACICNFIGSKQGKDFMRNNNQTIISILKGELMKKEKEETVILEYIKNIVIIIESVLSNG